MFADVASHVATERSPPARHETVEMLGVSLKILAGGIVPSALPLAAEIDLIGFEPAVDLASFDKIATLAIVGWLAVRDAAVPTASKIGIIVAVALLGMVVVGLEPASHYVYASHSCLLRERLPTKRVVTGHPVDSQW